MVTVRYMAAGALAAAVAVCAAVPSGCGSGTREHESVPAPSVAPAPHGRTLVEDRAATATAVDAGSGPAVGLSAGDRVDADPELAVELVEELQPAEAAAGARDAEPLEPRDTGQPDGAGISGRAALATGETYTWHDGDRILEVALLPDLTVVDENAAGALAPDQDVVAKTGSVQIVTRGAGDAPGGQKASGTQEEGTSSGQPVFLSESGELMTLPGGVIVILDEGWDSDDTEGFFTSNGISMDRVSELDYLTNGFLIGTEPGLPSLELANALATRAGVVLSSPNWSRERTTR